MYCPWIETKASQSHLELDQKKSNQIKRAALLVLCNIKITTGAASQTESLTMAVYWFPDNSDEKCNLPNAVLSECLH